LELAFKSFRPNILIHAAALKHVSALEVQPREAFLTNIRGTCNVAECLKIYPVDSALFISTDKAANPTSILGSTKLIGERIWAFQAENVFQPKSYSVVRFGNVFLSRGSVVETFIAQLRLGQEITITDTEMTRFFMDVKESAQIITLLLNKKVEGVSILKMGAPISIVDLANRLAKFYEIDARIKLIGAKSGEKTHEELFTESEFAQVTDFGVYLNMPFPKTNMTLRDVGENPKNDQEAREQIQDLLRH
jgi:FlaA1/EpsC-like NDP-sugar epimerase